MRLPSANRVRPNAKAVLQSCPPTKGFSKWISSRNELVPYSVSICCTIVPIVPEGSSRCKPVTPPKYLVMLLEVYTSRHEPPSNSDLAATIVGLRSSICSMASSVSSSSVLRSVLSASIERPRFICSAFKSSSSLRAGRVPDLDACTCIWSAAGRLLIAAWQRPCLNPSCERSFHWGERIGTVGVNKSIFRVSGS